MASNIKQLTLWGLGSGNPPKVAFILEELGLPYEAIPLTFQEVKEPRILALNPNGRMPILQDPNTDTTIWESGAIIQYLIATYDKAHKLSFPVNTPNYWNATQMLFFQVSGQGPYYGQAFVFKQFIKPPIPVAIERYVKEIHRVSGVLEGLLDKAPADPEGHKWLVGGKLSYVDFSFLLYQITAMKFYQEDGYDEAKDFPQIKKWRETLMRRESVKKALMAGEPWKSLGLFD